MRTVPIVLSMALGLVTAGCSKDGSVKNAEPAPKASPAAAALVCPVSGEPAKDDVMVVHNGQDVHFCCNDCIAAFKKSPEKYAGRGGSAAAGSPQEAAPSRRPEGSGTR